LIIETESGQLDLISIDSFPLRRKYLKIIFKKEIFMKFLILIFSIFAISCGQSPADKDKDKGVAATYILPVANSLRPVTTTPDSDTLAAVTQATKLTYVKSLPLYDVSTRTAAEIKALSLDGVVESVNMTTGNPVVKFHVATKATSSLPASRVTGFGWTTKSSTLPSGTTRYASNLTAVSNINFSIAKLVAGTNGGPDKWVSYIVTTMPVTEGSDGTNTYTRPAAWSLPTNDVNGTIVDLGDGSYTYTFGRDITTVKNFIGTEYKESRTTAYSKATAATAVSSLRQANTGDLTYNANLPHRVIVYLGTGTVRGTGTNHTNGTDANTGVTALNFDDGETLAYDFVPATNQVKALQRDITTTTTCNNCHKSAVATTTSGITTRGLIFHGSGGRNDVRHCVMCHTDQLKSATDTFDVSTNGVFPTTTNGYVLDGYNVVDFPIMVHKFHMSSNLTKSGDGYYAVNSSYRFRTKAAAFITLADSKLCYNCHTSNKSTVSEDNWKTKPTRIACGSCHDGVDFATGLMFKSARASSTDITHGGGKQLDDSQCASCHTVSDVIKKHGL